MNHLGDTNKMVDTPRTEAEVNRQKCWSDDLVTIDANFACQLERELNAANAEIEEKRKDVVWLATEKAKLEEQLMDTKNKYAVLVADVVLNEDRAKRIKRLEEAGDAVAAIIGPPGSAHWADENQVDAAWNNWTKAKEDKL